MSDLQDNPVTEIMENGCEWREEQGSVGPFDTIWDSSVLPYNGHVGGAESWLEGPMGDTGTYIYEEFEPTGTNTDQIIRQQDIIGWYPSEAMDLGQEPTAFDQQRSSTHHDEVYAHTVVPIPLHHVSQSRSHGIQFFDNGGLNHPDYQRSLFDIRSPIQTTLNATVPTTQLEPSRTWNLGHMNIPDPLSCDPDVEMHMHSTTRSYMSLTDQLSIRIAEGFSQRTGLISNAPCESKAGVGTVVSQIQPSLHNVISTPPELGTKSEHSSRNTDVLVVPDRKGPRTTNSTMPEILHCTQTHCTSKFSGKHRKGNWQRHKRQRHGARKAECPCQDMNCERVFERTDARLKHHRKYHPQLAPQPAKPREHTKRRKAKVNSRQNGIQSEETHQETSLVSSSLYQVTEDSLPSAKFDGAQAGSLRQNDLSGLEGPFANL